MRLLEKGFLASAFLLLCSPTSGMVQETGRKVTVKVSQDLDLKRPAYVFRVSVEQIENARLALEEATDLLEGLDHLQIKLAAQVPSLWVQIHRRQAPQRLQNLVAIVSKSVPQLEKGLEYEQLSRFAIRVAAETARIDPDRALKILRDWPGPPDWLGDEADSLFEKLTTGLGDERFQSRFMTEPSSAIRNLLNTSLTRHYSSLYSRRHDRDRNDRLLDEIAAEFREGPVDSSRLAQFSHLVRVAGYAQTDRMPELFFTLEAALDRADLGGGTAFRYESDQGSVELTETEHRLLGVLRTMRGQPQALLDLLDSRPRLRGKLDELGGIDGALRARPGNRAGRNEVRHHRDPMAVDVPQIVAALRAAAVSRPWRVRQQLRKIGEGSGGFELLMRVYRHSHHQHPELAELVLAHIELLADSSEDSVERSARLKQYLKAYQEFGGELEPHLIDRGFAALQDLREESIPALGFESFSYCGMGSHWFLWSHGLREKRLRRAHPDGVPDHDRSSVVR